MFNRLSFSPYSLFDEYPDPDLHIRVGVGLRDWGSDWRFSGTRILDLCWECFPGLKAAPTSVCPNLVPLSSHIAKGWAIVSIKRGRKMVPIWEGTLMIWSDTFVMSRIYILAHCRCRSMAPWQTCIETLKLQSRSKNSFHCCTLYVAHPQEDDTQPL